MSKYTSKEVYDAFHLMHEMGGGFARRLADAWFYADSENKWRIETAFPELVDKYVRLMTTDIYKA
jgi:hypothetical protein